MDNNSIVSDSHIETVNLLLVGGDIPITEKGLPQYIYRCIDVMYNSAKIKDE